MNQNPAKNRSVEERLDDLDARLSAIEEMLADFYDEANLIEEEGELCGEECGEEHDED